MVPTLKRVLAAYLASITVEPVAAEPLCRQLFSKICTDINGDFESGAGVCEYPRGGYLTKHYDAHRPITKKGMIVAQFLSI
jgi:hypothetical protein